MPRCTVDRQPCHRRRVSDCNRDVGCTLDAHRHCRIAGRCLGLGNTACPTNPACRWRLWNARSRVPACYAVSPERPQPPVVNLRRIISYSLFWGLARGQGYRGQQLRIGMSRSLVSYPSFLNSSTVYGAVSWSHQRPDGECVYTTMVMLSPSWGACGSRFHHRCFNVFMLLWPRILWVGDI